MEEAIADLAVRALVAEAELEGKPGLVCPGSKGAHEDMDFHLFVESAASLRECFQKCTFAGMQFQGSELKSLLPSLRAIGLEGERAMYAATGGVNTHKGAVFSIGLLAAMAGMIIGGAASFGRKNDSASSLIVKGEPAVHLADRICDHAGRLCEGLVAGDFSASSGGATAGARLYRESGFTGARGQAEAGFPIVREGMLPRLRAARGEGSSGGSKAYECACLGSLLVAISLLDDSCLFSRGGMEALRFAKSGAAAVLAEGVVSSSAGRRALHEYSQAMLAKRLSPGGSADMLSCAIFLDMVEMRYNHRET